MVREAIREPKFKALGEKAYIFANRAPEYDKRINILEGAVRSSKTWAMIPKMLALCKYQVGGRKVITGASKMAIYNNVLDDLFEVIGPKNYSYNQQSGKLRLFDSQWRVIGASDAGADKYIRGMTIGACYCDELVKMPHNVFEMLMSRMSPANSRLYATTNPDSPYHWVREDLLDKKELQGDIFVEHFQLADNPNLDPSFVAFLHRKYSGIFHKRFIQGLWVLAEGSIYRDVLTDDIFYDDAQRPAGLKARGGHVEHWLAIDEGVHNPFVAIDTYDDSRTVWYDSEFYWDSQQRMRQLSDREKVDHLLAYMDECAGHKLDPRERPGIIIDPSAASLKVELTQRGMYVVDAKNDVDAGISRVSSMLNLKKIKINKPRCPNGVKEMQTYAWDEKKAANGKEQPIKAHDHYCFTSGTLVQTPNGQVAIERLMVGDLVSTPLGPARILRTGTRQASVIPWNGTRVTPEHPVWTKSGWIRTDAIRYTDEVCQWSNRLFSTGLLFAAILNRSASATNDISNLAVNTSCAAWRAFTARCGRLLMAISQTASMFTTKTKMRGIMSSPILSFCQMGSIVPCTGASELQADLSSWKASGLLPPHGIVLKPAALGIANTVNGYSLIEPNPSSPVITAAQNSLLSLIASFVLTLVKRLPGSNLAWIMSPGLARNAAGHLALTSTTQSGFVAGHAVCENATVYALATEHGCYFANGVLVSNCDAVRYHIETRINDWRLAA